MRVVITGNFGPCDECKLRIESFIERVQRLVTRAKRNTALQPFVLRVESRYLHATVPSREDGDRDTTYGYDNDQMILIGPLLAYEKVATIQIT